VWKKSVRTERVRHEAGLFSFENPVFRQYLGDGTGYSLAFSKRNAATATKLATARTIGGVSFDGTANITPNTVASGATDGTFELGYKDIPQNSQTAAYTLVVGDRGKHIAITTGGVHGAGERVQYWCRSNDRQQQRHGSDDHTGRVRDAAPGGTANTGNRTLLAWGVATVLCIASNVFVINGNIS
jgi:hypothetical protein